MIVMYVTCADEDEAKKISYILLERNLIACANVFAPHTAIYKWGDAIQTDTETVMVLKTVAHLFEDVRNAILEHHSYECPAIVAMPIVKGHDPFLEWISKQTLDVPK